MVYAKKSLGQNFLKSEKALREITEAGDIQTKDTILEIGPGEGALTERILEKKPKKLIVVEKDDRLISFLQEKFSDHAARFNVVHGDILELLSANQDTSNDATILIKNLVPPYKVIANIPYYITGAVIRDIFELDMLPEKVVLLLQKEVADRIVAADKKESLLSLSVKLYGTPKRISTVPRGAFVPAPNVDSAIICIEHIARKIKKEQELEFFTLIKAAFAHKRKQLAGNLDKVNGKSREEWAKIIESIGFPANVRAEDLSVEDFILLAQQ